MSKPVKYALQSLAQHLQRLANAEGIISSPQAREMPTVAGQGLGLCLYGLLGS